MSNKKLFIEDKEIQPTKEIRYKNVIFLKDDSQFEGNLIEIKDESIIFDTKDGRKKFQRKILIRISTLISVLLLNQICLGDITILKS